MQIRALIILTALASAVSQTSAFGVQKTLQTASNPASVADVHNSLRLGFAKHDSKFSRCSLNSRLQMASDISGEKTIIGKDFRLSAIFLGGGLLLDNIPYLQVTIGPIITLLGILFLVQTFRLNFVCDETTFSLEDTSSENSVGENIVVGGENRWSYDSFVNYDFFPEGWIDQPQGPILVYFKETQTPSDKWNDGPGASANSDEALAKGAVKGQVHFFPALCDTQQLRAIWEKKRCSKL